jgi:nitrite reductase/ring-hydroxylating ferredoxin subunit
MHTVFSQDADFSKSEPMSNAWKAYRSAPPDGAVICADKAVADDSTKSVLVTSSAGQFPILLIKTDGTLRAYVNACPHQYLPLDHRGDKLLSADRGVIRCTNHGAGFRVQDGAGIEGLGIGCNLDAVPVRIDTEGLIRIDENKRPAATAS